MESAHAVDPRLTQEWLLDDVMVSTPCPQFKPNFPLRIARFSLRWTGWLLTGTGSYGRPQDFKEAVLSESVAYVFMCTWTHQGDSRHFSDDNESDSNGKSFLLTDKLQDTIALDLSHGSQDLGRIGRLQSIFRIIQNVAEAR